MVGSIFRAFVDSSINKVIKYKDYRENEKRDKRERES